MASKNLASPTGISATLNTSLAVPAEVAVPLPRRSRQNCCAKDAHTDHACIGDDHPAVDASCCQAVGGGEPITD
jgi:hypothetical protein